MGEATVRAHPETAEQQPGPYGYGLHIDPPAYREMMRAFALHLGASERTGEIGAVRLRSEDGFVEAITLEDGSEIAADLYVDASGPAALVRSALGGERYDWSKWLIADRVLFSDGAAIGDVPPLDRAIALDAGWRWEAESPARSSRGLVYSSHHLSDADAADLLGAEPGGPATTILAGRQGEPWLRNCIAIGDSAVALEPLEWTNLHLAHSAIDRLVAMMPDRDCNPVELWDYNRQANAEADRVRDFVLLHYAVSRRDGDFWKDAAKPPLPHSLAHTLTQFKERGRLPFYEEETFSRDSWLAVLIGQGVVPRRIDPLLDAIPKSESERELKQIHSAIQAAVERLPAHSDYLQTMARNG
jgi:tryptophan 7-halogenase